MWDRVQEVFDNLGQLCLTTAFALFIMRHIWSIFIKNQKPDSTYFFSAFLMILLIGFMPVLYGNLVKVSKSAGESMQPEGMQTTMDFFYAGDAKVKDKQNDLKWNDVSEKGAVLVWQFEYYIVRVLNGMMGVLLEYMGKMFAPLGGLLIVLTLYPLFQGKAVGAIIFFTQVLIWPIGWGLAEAMFNLVAEPFDNLYTISRLAGYGAIRCLWFLAYLVIVSWMSFLLFGINSGVGSMLKTGLAAAGGGIIGAGLVGRKLAKGGGNLADNLSGGRLGSAAGAAKSAVQNSAPVRAAQKIREATQMSHSQRAERVGKVLTSGVNNPTPKQAMKMPAIR